MTNSDYDKAYKLSINNKSELLGSKYAGCFYCKKIFNVNQEEIEYVDDGNTALCPKCGIDSVIGDKSGIMLNSEFLAEMHNRYF